MINITPAGRVLRITEDEVELAIRELQEFSEGAQLGHHELDCAARVNESYGDVYADEPEPTPQQMERDKQIVREAIEHLRSKLPSRN